MPQKRQSVSTHADRKAPADFSNASSSQPVSTMRPSILWHESVYYETILVTSKDLDHLCLSPQLITINFVYRASYLVVIKSTAMLKYELIQSLIIKQTEKSQNISEKEVDCGAGAGKFFKERHFSELWGLWGPLLLYMRNQQVNSIP